MRIVFFGTPDLAVIALDELEQAGFLPTLIVTQPDRPVGRKQEVTAPLVKIWAHEHDIEVLQTESLKEGEVRDILLNSEWDLFIVAAYGLILPNELVQKPLLGSVNVHPSLLPKYRGPTPVQAQILADDRFCGVTVMQMDDKMDHGPILTQASITFEESEWPISSKILYDLLWHEGGKLLAETIPLLKKKELTPTQQDHDQATYSSMLKKEDGEIDLSGDAYQNYLKYCAYGTWPGTFFFTEKDGKRIRVKIVEAEYEHNTFTPLRVIPEGKKEMAYQTFLQ